MMNSRHSLDSASFDSRHDIKWIRHLEYAFGVAAAKIAILVSNIGDDGKARSLDLLLFQE